MTLNTTDSKVAYAGDGSTTVFAIPFKFLADGDIEALLRNDATGAETGWTENTEYTLSGAGSESGGTLTVATSPTNFTPQTGETLVIRRSAAEVQGAAFPAGGAFPSATVETGLDRLTMLVQQHTEALSRALSVPATDPAEAIAPLPSSVARAAHYLAFDAAGKPVAAVAPEGGNVVSSFMADLLDDSAAGQARTTLGVEDTMATALANGTLVASVAANALTIALKTRAGSDPSPNDPAWIVFRSADNISPADAVRAKITTSLSVTVPAGATLGTANGKPFHLWVVATYDGVNGVQLGVANCLTSTSTIYRLRQWDVHSVHALDVSADSGATLYALAAAGTALVMPLGRLTWRSGLTAAGTWSAAPDDAALYQPGVTPLPGEVVTRSAAFSNTFVYGSGTAIPFDDTIPQNTEGDQFMSGDIYRSDPANVLVVRFAAAFSWNIGDGLTVAMFQDTGADAVQARPMMAGTSNLPNNIAIEHHALCAAVGATNFKVRAGSHNGAGVCMNGYFDGTINTRLYGSALYASLIIEEVQT